MTTPAQTPVVELLKTPFFKVVQDGKYYIVQERAKENGVVVAAQREDGCFLVARLFRQAIGGFSYEFPRGAIDAGEMAVDAARREVMEETGCFCTEVTLVGRMHSNTSLLSSHVALAYARVNSAMSSDTDGEVDSIEWVSEDALDQMIMSGKITDSHTLSALLLVRTLAAKG
jgi:ADP-ribose pyrophosphatase